MFEMIKSLPSRLPECKWERERVGWEDDLQREHHLLNPCRRQRNRNQLNKLSRSLTSHLRGGVKRTTSSRKCARGSPHYWTRQVATRSSGRTWVLGCVTHVMALARITDFPTDLLLPLNAPYSPPISLFFPHKGGISNSRHPFPPWSRRKPRTM